MSTVCMHACMVIVEVGGVVSFQLLLRGTPLFSRAPFLARYAVALSNINTISLLSLFTNF